MSAVALLSAAEAEAEIEDLAEILWDCVDGGASVNFVKPFTREEARGFWRRAIASTKEGGTVMLAARQQGRLAGTVLLGVDTPPNQPHRADIKKLLVHRRARRLGLAKSLMAAVEVEARRRGRHLLTLDTQCGSTAERLYHALGYTLLGIIPRYAVAPDGGAVDDCAFFYKTLAQ
jgi:ribosomal protein S18 acetylase RimI-like enzyme